MNILANYGLTEGYLNSINEKEKTSYKPENIARVTAVHKERYELITEFGEAFGRLKTKEYYLGGETFPTVGDFVLINYIPGSDSQIVKTLERKTLFSRRDPDVGKGEQVVAANFDRVFIVQSLNQNFNLGRLERYITVAEESRAEIAIVLTKADLVSESLIGEYIDRVKTVAGNTADILAVSVVNGYGTGKLNELLKCGKTAVFLGSSGVGKSSLLKFLAEKNIMKVNSIREEDGRGRHTTTHRELIKLENGAMIIDTPGMRELGMWDISTGIKEAFWDVTKYFPYCKFKDCKHEKEPGCAVKAAIESGELKKERFESYLLLKMEAKYSDSKDGYMKLKEEKFKNISKKNKNIQKYRNRYDDF